MTLPLSELYVELQVAFLHHYLETLHLPGNEFWEAFLGKFMAYFKAASQKSHKRKYLEDLLLKGCIIKDY